MATDLPDIELIESYLNGELAEKERLHFESEMENNVPIKAAVEEHLKSLALAKEMGKEQWKEQMRGRFLSEAPKVRELNRRMIFAIAASVLALLIIGGLWWTQNNQSLSSEEWIATHVEIPTAPEFKSPEEYVKWAEANLDYNQGNYQAALDKYREIEPEYTGGFLREISFYKGMSLIYLEQYSEARQNLEKIDRGAYMEMAAWYYALSFVQEGELELAEKELEKIAKQTGFYQAKAKELLKTF